MLEQELKFYQENLKKWLAQHKGKFVLVKDTQLVGIFDNEGDALAEGVKRFGLTSFLVRHVQETQPLVRIPSLWS